MIPLLQRDRCHSLGCYKPRVTITTAVTARGRRSNGDRAQTCSLRRWILWYCFVRRSSFMKKKNISKRRARHVGRRYRWNTVLYNIDIEPAARLDGVAQRDFAGHTTIILPAVCLHIFFCIHFSYIFRLSFSQFGRRPSTDRLPTTYQPHIIHIVYIYINIYIYTYITLNK